MAATAVKSATGPCTPAWARMMRAANPTLRVRSERAPPAARAPQRLAARVPLRPTLTPAPPTLALLPRAPLCPPPRPPRDSSRRRFAGAATLQPAASAPAMAPAKTPGPCPRWRSTSRCRHGLAPGPGQHIRPGRTTATATSMSAPAAERYRRETRISCGPAICLTYPGGSPGADQNRRTGGARTGCWAVSVPDF